jgi:NADPH:quinone reductase-like Zn-dependent oxidoreductase
MQMKAIVRRKYGSPNVLQLEEVEKPAPADNQVLVRVCAASINKADLYFLRGPFVARLMGVGLLKPKNKMLGTDIAGRVEVVGGNVEQFQPGDEVFGWCGQRAFAEFACARENALMLKPANVTFDEAAAVPVAAITALQALRDKGHAQSGQRVLINGASGGVGTFAVQIAKSFGAEVTAVCSARNLDNARMIGADHVVDYTQDDVTKNGQSYDLIIQVNGYHSILDYRHALSPKGIYIQAGGSRVVRSLFEAVLLGELISIAGKKRMGFMGIAKMNQKDLVFLKTLLEAGKIKPVIDRRYTPPEVPEAFRYFEEGHAKGKVIITLEHTPQEAD